MLPRFLVLMATHNGEKWVVEQIQSILSQLEVDVDIYVSDDASSDGTVDLIKSTFPMESRIKYIHFNKPAGGAAANFLRALCRVDLQSYDFLSFSDQDDVWDSDKLISASRALVSKNMVAYSCATRAVWDSGAVRVLGQNPSMRSYDFIFEGAGQGCSFVLRSDFALKVVQLLSAHPKLIVGIHYHDWLIYSICRCSGYGWYFDPLPHMDYRQHGLNDTGARFSLKGVFHRVHKIRDGWYFGQVKLIFDFLIGCKLISPADEGGVIEMLRGRSLIERLKFSVWNLKNGRRRLSDRVVVSVAIFMGWHLGGVK